VEAAPKVVVGIALVVAAVVVAKVVEKILRVILVRVRFDDLVARAGVDTMLQRVGIRQELNRFIPRLVYFLLLFLMARTAADALGLTAISGAFGTFLGYLPNVVAALLLLILGSAAAQFAGQTVRDAAASSGIEFAPSLGKLVSSLIMFVIVIMAVAQLKIDTEIVRLVTAFLLAGMALAFGLAFGLGSRDVTRSILAGFYARKILRVGDTVEIGGESGVLHAITPTHAILETDGRKITVSNTAFIEGISRQS
jgi:small-conductance mechanosensitive channel